MPRLIVTTPGHDRNRSLGWLAVAWMESLIVHGPGDVQGMPVRHGDEYTGFIVDCYALDEHGRRLYDSAFLSRPKGCDKSGLGARIALFEALGPCRFAGWAKGGEVYRDPFGLGFTYEYLAGEPMGRGVRTPFIRCMATEEGQTGNVYDSVYYNLTEGPLAAAMDNRDSAGITRILLPKRVGPEGGQVIPSTASSAAKDGGKETWACFDETHLYVRPELRRMYDTVGRNLRKRKKIAETWYLETTTMYADGEESVAQSTYELAQLIKEGKTRRSRLLLDHRWGDLDDAELSDETKLREALTDAYGDALEWNDLDSMVNEFYDPRKAVRDSVRYFLNNRSTLVNQWVSAPEWNACGRLIVAERREEPILPLQSGDRIALGFDGSRGRVAGVADATALVATRVDDGLQTVLAAWEQPEGAAGIDWQVPLGDVDAAVTEAFKTFDVTAFFADPAKWETSVAKWEAKYGAQLPVKASRNHPIEWWMTGRRAGFTVRALQAYKQAIIDGVLIHDQHPVLTRHVLNARMVNTRFGVQIRKENPASRRKIDAAVAAVLSWEARMQALAQPERERKKTFIPARIR